MVQIVLGSLLLVSVLTILVAVCCCVVIAGQSDYRAEKMFVEHINKKDEVV